MCDATWAWSHPASATRATAAASSGRSSRRWPVSHSPAPTASSPPCRRSSRAAISKIRVAFLGHDKIGFQIARADIATFMLDQIDDGRFLHAAPAVSN